MNDMAQLRPRLARLKLTGILENLEHHLKAAADGGLSYTDFLLRLVEDESERRESKKHQYLLRKSGMDSGKTLESYEFGFNPCLSESSIRELATCDFIRKKENVFFLGPSGVGKTHLAQGLGHAAIRKGCEVIFRNTLGLLRSLNSSRGDGTWHLAFKNICSADLVILDDFGLNDLSPQQQEDLYEMICGRYRKGSFIITTNRDLPEWPSVFTNPLIGSAAIDRLVDGALKFVIEGKSYRMDNFMKRNSIFIDLKS